MCFGGFAVKQKTSINTLSNKFLQKKYSYYLLYTTLFFLGILMMYMIFIKNNVSFIWKHSSADGYTQHYTSLVYLGQWGRQVLKNIFINHTFEIPLWDFSIGYGADILSSMNYYAFGDPLNIFSIFVPSEYTEYLYNFLVIARLYLAGLSFSWFSFKLNRGKKGTLAGAFVYIFCGFVIYAGIRHPFFINPMIYLPLLLLGVEKIYRKESFAVFTIAVCVSAISNFYFFYMIAIITAIYVIVRYFTMARQHCVKDALHQLLKVFGSAILGVGLSAFIFLPIVYVFLTSTRTDSALEQNLLYYNWNYYETLITSAFSNVSAVNWTCLTFAAPSFASIVTLFMTKNKHKGVKITFVVLFGMTLIPVFGKIFNGFSYVSNRWSFALAGIVAIIVATIWEDMLSLTKKQLIVLGISTALYCILAVALHGIGRNLFISLAIIMGTCMLLIIYKKHTFPFLTKNVTSLLLVLMILVSSGVNAYYKYSSRHSGYAEQFLQTGEALQGIKKSSDAIAQKYTSKEDTFVRNEQDEISNSNASVITKSTGLQFFWSLENSGASDFFFENGLNNFLSQKYQNLNGRAFLNSLASVKYFISSDEEPPKPYGFDEIDTLKRGKKEYTVYKNNHSLPLGYTYSSYIDKIQYNQMTMAEKQQALVQSVVLEDTNSTKGLELYQQGIPEFTHTEVKCSVSVIKNATIESDSTIIAHKKKAKIKLTFEGLENCDYYLNVENMYFDYISKYELYNDDNDDYWSQEEFNALEGEEKDKVLDSKNVKYGKDNCKALITVTSKNPDKDAKTEENKIKFTYITEQFRYATGQDDFLVNIGYSKNARTSVVITLPIRGAYSFENLSIICQPMENYETNINSLKEDIMVNEEIGTNTVSGEITLDKDKILCLSVPYNTGWTAYVDGKETEILKANTMYMALPLTKGKHTIKLVYTTPYIMEGAVISLISLTVFVALWIIIKRKFKNKQVKI